MILMYFTLLMGSCASGLYIPPETSRVSSKRILIYEGITPLSARSIELSKILAKEIKYEVLSYQDLKDITGKIKLDSNQLESLNIGLVIIAQNISFFRRIVKEQPFVQIRIQKSSPVWKWVFLSTIKATFQAYEVTTENMLLRGFFPPETFREFCAKYGIGRKSTCPKTPKFNFESWARSKDAAGFSKQYITLYVGKHTEYETHKPKMTEPYFKASDKEAMKKLVSYIAKNIPDEYVKGIFFGNPEKPKIINSINEANRKSSIRPIPVSSSKEKKFEAPSTVLWLITIKNSNIRAEPSIKSKIITTIKKGTKIEKIRESPDWFEVRLPSGKIGHVYKPLVNEIKLGSHLD